MNVVDAITSRHSVRGYKPEPIAPEILHDIFAAAQWAPSNCNIQTWRVDVVSGAAKDDLSKALLAEVVSGKEQYPDFFPGNAGLEGVYRDRQFDCAMRYYSTMGIERSDKAGRSALMLKNWEFFGAPHAAFISMPKNMQMGHVVDIGIYLQSLMLVMQEKGIGSCAQGALMLYPGPVKAQLNLPEDHGIICGLSFGYPDDNAHINTVRMSRDPVEEHVFFHR